MTNTMQYAGNQGANVPNLDRRPSPFVWKDCPIQDILSGVVDGVYFFDDFLETYLTVPTTEAVFPPYKAFTSTGGTINPAAGAWGGQLALGSDGDDEGASLNTVLPFFQISRSNGKFWFECRVNVNTTAVTQYDAFIGLGEKMTLTAAVPITATAGLLADKNLVGWQRPGTSTTGDGSIAQGTYKADGVTAVVVQANAGAFVANTFLKLGMIFDPKDNFLRFYINGIESGNKLIPVAAGTDFPNDVVLGPIMGVTNTSANTSVFTVDWWRGCQLGV